LRILVREHLQAGESDRQVIDFLVARYGEFVLLRPRFSWHTALLWLGPAAVLLVGACGLLVLARRYRTGLNRANAEGEKVTPGGSGAAVGDLILKRYWVNTAVITTPLATSLDAILSTLRDSERG
jgi:hypothetical protein